MAAVTYICVLETGYGGLFRNSLFKHLNWANWALHCVQIVNIVARSVSVFLWCGAYNSDSHWSVLLCTAFWRKRCSDLRLIAALEMLRGLRTHSSNFANYSTPAIQSCTKLISSLSFTSFLSIQKKSRLLPMFRGPRYVDIIKKVANFLTNLNPFRKLTSNTHLRVRGVQFATISHSLGWL